VVIAAVCTSLVEVTGSLVWDGVGSVLVGLILGGVAIFLIQRNRNFLIGRSMNSDDFQRIVRHLKRDPVVKNIYEAKSEEIGEGIYRCALPARSTMHARHVLCGECAHSTTAMRRRPPVSASHSCRFNAEIDFHGPNLLEKYMSKKDVAHMRQQFARACSNSSNPAEFETLMKAYGTEVVSLVGAQVRRYATRARVRARSGVVGLGERLRWHRWLERAAEVAPMARASG
jgi:hypothetical protein